MKNSLNLRIFLSAIVCVLAFIVASRIVVRLLAYEPMLTYLSEVFARQIEPQLHEFDESTDINQLKSKLIYPLDGVGPNQVLLFRAQESQPKDAFLAEVETKISLNLPWRELAHQNAKTVQVMDLDLEGETWRIFRFMGRSDSVIHLGLRKSMFLNVYLDILNVRNAVSLRVYLVVFLFVILFTAFMSYACLKPLKDLQARFSTFEINRPYQKIATKDYYSEFAFFIKYFDDLIQNLRQSYEQAARFSSDAAHELRTPLTIMRGHLQALINSSKDGSKDQLELSLIMDEVERLISVSNKLLLLSQADAGCMILSKTKINLNDMMGQMFDDFQMFHPEIDFERDFKETLFVHADADLFLQLMTNLMNNAVKYNTTPGQVLFSARTTAQTLVFSLTNTTDLSAAGLDERIFERFYRHRVKTIQGHDSAVAGSGLGLSLCREIVRAHHGELVLIPRHGNMITFQCTFPLG